MISETALLSLGFKLGIWMDKTFQHPVSGINFTLSINAISGWATLSQYIEEGFSLLQIADMKELLDEQTKIILKHNTITLIPFKNIKDVEYFWAVLTQDF